MLCAAGAPVLSGRLWVVVRGIAVRLCYARSSPAAPGCLGALQAYEEARELFRRHRGLIAIGGSEWPNIRCGGLCQLPPVLNEQSACIMLLRLDALPCHPAWRCCRTPARGAASLYSLSCHQPTGVSCPLSATGSAPLSHHSSAPPCDLLALALPPPTLTQHGASCRSDLLELASPAAVAAKMRSTQRMMRSYAIFQQF